MSEINEPPDAGAKGERLLDCPFCGREPGLLKSFSKPLAICQTFDCPITGLWIGIDLWNNRSDVTLTASHQECERLRVENANILKSRNRHKQENNIDFDNWMAALDEVKALKSSFAAALAERDAAKEYAIQWANAVSHYFPPDKTYDPATPMETVGQMVDALSLATREARNAALEEAAKICDQAYLENMNGHGDIDTSPEAIAAAIRALMGEKGDERKDE